MVRSGPLDELVRRARHRHLWNLILTQAVHAICVAVGGIILLLLLGTQVLDWPWIVALLAIATGLGVRRTLGHFPSKYAVLQGVDHRLGLSDSLSTAFYFKEMANGRGVCESMRVAQLERAERLSREADLERAVPIAAPRSLYMLAALAVVASSLFALRYGVSRRLDLRPPLASILFQSLRAPAPEQASTKKKDDLPQRLKRMLKDLGFSVENKGDRPLAGEDTTAESVPGEASQAENRSARASTANQPKPLPLQVKAETADQGENAGSAEGSEGAGDRASSELSSSHAGESENASAGAQEPPNLSAENKNLLEHFREAMANLLSKLKSQPRPGGSQMAASSAQGSAEAGRSRNSPGQQGTPGSGRQQSEGTGSDSPSDQQAQSAETAQAGSGKPGGKDSDLRASREGKSGIGREDGAKAVREAEQLAAMGKISEIFGRRQANLSGEVTVEVASGNQRLKTPYSQQQAAHAEAGGEIHRDEIPLAVQQYVQQYFEEVRKTPAPAHPVPAKPASRQR